MNCNQCEQTLKGGCTTVGVCGKNEDIASLQDTVIYALKGIAAYAYHARELGYHDETVDAFMHKALFSTLTNVNFNLQEHIALALETGSVTIKAMELLDKAHTDKLGMPEPSSVEQNKVEGKAILVTGHDLFALKKLLEQSEGKGVNIYTHSEMLPAHSYPELKKFKHMKGNIGKSWTDQRVLFEKFQGAILGTTNCVVPVLGNYAERMFTYGIAGLEKVKKIENEDFSPLIEKALSLPDVEMVETGKLTTGFHHSTILALAPKILEAVKSGKIKRFFVIAGCDAPGTGNDYFGDLARTLPDDVVILTSACGKFRFNDHGFGDIDGLPRLIDVGQCNNSISLIKVATGLAEALDCGVNDLPLTIVLSWFEQKAVAILLGLFSLGVKNVWLGAKAPEFLTSGVVKVLQDSFNLQLTTNVEDDLKKMLG
ncbi:MAG: hydroxylamine reductase [Nanoarchaeota archaeon]|nr:hydroxylamine reductase [Nanoarchaeota archaeon]